jgi:general secretion pathway protein L
MVRWLDLPGRNEAQGRAAALWTLRDDLAAPPERLRVSLGPHRESDGRRLVAVASGALVNAWIAYAESLGVTPDVIVPDHLTVSPPQQGEGLTSVGFGPMTALRGNDLSVTVEPDLAPLIAGDRPVTPVERAEDVEAMLVQTALNPPLNLIGRTRAAAEGMDAWRRAAVMAGLLILSPLLLLGVAAARDDLAARALNNESAAMLREAFPDMAPDADPAAEAMRQLNATSASGGVTGVTAALFAAVEQVEGAELDALSVYADGQVRATVSYGAYGDLEALDAALLASGLSMTDESTLEEDGRMVSDVIIGAAA